MNNPSVVGDGDEDGDGFIAGRCSNPWLTSTRPTSCNPATLQVVEPTAPATKGEVRGNDCNDSPAVVPQDGGVGGDAGDGGVLATGREVHPGQPELCNGLDDNCSGATDEGVCPCPAGYLGWEGNCTDVDECSTGAPCGNAAGVSCTNVDGSYVCSCPQGFVAPVMGGTCADVDECTAGTPCGLSAVGCTNTDGSYTCLCGAGYAAPAVGGTCADVDECSVGTPCGTVAGAMCSNLNGGYTCRRNSRDGQNCPA